MAFFRKRPIVLEAKQLTPKTIKEVYEFIHGEGSVNISCAAADDYWEAYERMVNRDGMKLKTPESDNETQIISMGDFVFKGHSEKLGWHFWPVKPDYVAEHYEELMDDKFTPVIK